MSERDPRELAALSSALELKTNVSDRSTPGVYITLTRSGAVYIADIHDPDATPTVTRYAGGAANALRDGQPLPGVHGFSFNASTGLGAVLWWKDPTECTDPSLPYAGTTRSTSRVLLVARLKDETTAQQERAVSTLHELIRALRDPNLDYPALVACLCTDEE
ncbi:hypothetical protein PQI51_14565 [Microbacterium esteraromaticum]|uniref:hypothetical protein n=1 Tax=Microbacterium esteraromaticum TaxID=57043 RepID=UPI0030AA8AA3